MVFIITGKLNQGKTQKLKSIYDENKEGDGFIAKKVFDDDEFVGYDLVSLSSGAKKTFARLSEFIPPNWKEKYRLGPFTFSYEAFQFARKIIENAITHNIEPIYIDEIGPLELDGKGFNDILIDALNSEIEIYITVRESLVEAVIEYFNIEEYSIIHIK